VASRRAPCSPGIHFIVRLGLESEPNTETLESGLAYIQIVNNLTSQAATMVTHGIPNDVINNLDPIALIIFIPICDLFVYPGLRRLGINFTPIKRITAGFLTGSAAMIWAAVVQHYIYKVGSATFDDVDS
jgi:dipeptide/tripeptide permease